MSVFVVIPAYNEGEAVRDLVRQVSLHAPSARVIVVDDGSAVRVDREGLAPARVLRHPINLGKGMALRTGCEFALRHGAEAVVLMDGDGQHEPREIPRLIAALEEADIVFGARELGGDMPLVRRAGNLFLNRCTSWLFEVNLQDIWCGFRAFRAACFDRICWSADDYGVDVEMAIRAMKHRLRHRQVPIGTVYRDAYKGVTVLDGLRLLVRLVGWKFTL